MVENLQSNMWKGAVVLDTVISLGQELSCGFWIPGLSGSPRIFPGPLSLFSFPLAVSDPEMLPSPSVMD